MMTVTTIDGAVYTVAPSHHDGHGRLRWRYTISLADTVLDEGDDLSTVDHDPTEAMAALLGFLGAWLESDDPEVARLFPETCRVLDSDLIAIELAALDEEREERDHPRSVAERFVAEHGMEEALRILREGQ